MNQLEDQNEENIEEVVDDEDQNENNNQGSKPSKKAFLTPAQARLKEMKDKSKFNAQKTNVLEQVDKMVMNQIE
jgi:hypothetical protein